MRDENQIPFPTEQEKNDSIQKIIADGMPESCSLMRAMQRLLQEIRVRELIFGVEDCMFLAVLAAVLLWSAVFVSAKTTGKLLPLLLFFVSPFFYALLHLLTIWKEIMTGTYERLMTCRLSLHQMTVLRMLVFGGVSVLATTVMNAVFCAFLTGAGDYLRMMSISFSGLFLFAWMELLAEWKWKMPVCCIASLLFWGVSGILAIWQQEHIHRILWHVPTAVLALMAGVCAILYFGTLKKYYFDSKEGALAHAFS